MEYINIGELKSLVYIEEDTFKASGTLGDVIFNIIAAASRNRIQLPDGRHLLEPRLRLWLKRVSLGVTKGTAKFSTGEKIKLPSMMEVLEDIREHEVVQAFGNQMLFTPLMDNVNWMTPNGEACEAPPWYTPYCFFVKLYGLQNKYRGRLKKYDIYRGINEFMMVRNLFDCARGDYEGQISGELYEDLEAQCETVRDAAITINRHINKGDFKPNIAKLEAVKTLAAGKTSYGVEIKCDFAEAIRKCADSVLKAIEANDFRTTIDVVPRFSPLRYPGTKVISELG